MIACSVIFRWCLLLPVILLISTLPITVGAQINQSLQNTKEKLSSIQPIQKHGLLSEKLERKMNLEYQTTQKTNLNNNSETVTHYPKVIIAEKTSTSKDIAPKSVHNYPAQTSVKTRRGLSLKYAKAEQNKKTRQLDNYPLFKNDEHDYTYASNIVLANNPRRYRSRQKTRTYDFYEDYEKTRQKEKTILENDTNAPVILRAEQISGRPDRELHLDNMVEVEKGQTYISGGHGIFYQDKNEIEIINNVDITSYGDSYKSETAQINLDTGEGVLSHAKYKIGLTGGMGKAERIDLEDDDNTTIFDGTYTTCEGKNPDWYLSTDTLNLDTARNIGTAEYPVLYFKNTPILAASSLSFPLSGKRKSGFLPPTIGATSKGGMEIMVPHYFNLAPNYDLTIFPKYIAKRGFQSGAQARYLGHNYEGETYVEYLHDDKEAKRKRYAISSKHEHYFAPGWLYRWDFNKVSDDDYPDDFSTQALRGNRLLLQEGYLSYSANYVDITAGASRYQVLQDQESPIIPSYDRLPYLNINAHAYDLNGLSLTSNFQYTRFWLSDNELWNRQRGDRYIVNPEISLPIVSSGYFLTPKASLHYARYDLDDANMHPNQDRVMSRTIPTVSLDGGLIFERNTSLFGGDMTQTLEPRLFYVYTPYKNQNKYPVFDSGEPSFGYTQLFEENRFVGEDRISDANNLTAAVTSRFIEETGMERMRFTIGQRYYFSDQRVSLYTLTEKQHENQNENRSDLLLMASGLLTQKLAVDTSIQYNQSTKRTRSANYSLQWHPADKKIFNAEYRYLKDSVDEFGNSIDQINVSGQWPLANRWYAVGQVSYSLPESKTIESLFGLEYNADCWISRFVTQRYATSSTESNTAFFFQLELKGMSKLGSNPIESLRRGIPGYRPSSTYDE